MVYEILRQWVAQEQGLLTWKDVKKEKSDPAAAKANSWLVTLREAFPSSFRAFSAVR